MLSHIITHLVLSHLPVMSSGLRKNILYYTIFINCIECSTDTLVGELEQLQDQQQQHQPAFTATLDSDGLAATQDEVKKI